MKGAAMFYFMSKGDFVRISVVVEVINGKSYLLSNEDSQKILAWINNCDNEMFDQFCLAVSEEWSDSYPYVAINDDEGIVKIIHECLKDF